VRGKRWIIGSCDRVLGNARGTWSLEADTMGGEGSAE
jgi:hypothetical protein